jgi:hypothetical protein
LNVIRGLDVTVKLRQHRCTVASSLAALDIIDTGTESAYPASGASHFLCNRYVQSLVLPPLLLLLSLVLPRSQPPATILAPLPQPVASAQLHRVNNIHRVR